MDDNWGYHHDLGNHHLVISGPGRARVQAATARREIEKNKFSVACVRSQDLPSVDPSNTKVKWCGYRTTCTTYAHNYLSIYIFIHTLYVYILYSHYIDTLYIRNIRIICVYCKHYANMHKHIYTYACTYLYIYMHISIHKSVHNIHTWSYLYLLKYKYNCIYMHTKSKYTQIDIYRYTVHEQKNIYLQFYISTCMHTYIHYITLHYIHYIHYIHTYIHKYLHTYMSRCVHTYICTYIRTYVHTDIQTDRHTYRHLYHVYIYTSTHLHIYIYTNTHYYIYIYTRIYQYTY